MIAKLTEFICKNKEMWRLNFGYPIGNAGNGYLIGGLGSGVGVEP